MSDKSKFVEMVNEYFQAGIISQNITVLVLSYYIYKECWKSLNQLNFSHKCKAVGSDS